MNGIDVVGFLAATVTTVEVVPQVIKTLKTKSAVDLSWIALLMLIIGLALWTIYGSLMGDVWIVLSAAFSLLAYAFLAVIKITYEIKGETK